MGPRDSGGNGVLDLRIVFAWIERMTSPRRRQYHRRAADPTAQPKEDAMSES